MATLILEDGTRYEGTLFGHKAPVTGEVVFTTGMTGYQETLTDPSYCGQIVCMTYPLIGNVGVNDTRTWEATSAEKGHGLHSDNQFCVLDVTRKGKNYTLTFDGYGRQPSYRLERTL